LRPLGRALGLLTSAVDIPHRRVVKQNLRFAYPGWGARQIHATTRRVFQNAATTALEALAMARLGRSEILRGVRLSGAETFARALGEQRGVLLISAHLGNWEMALQFASCFIEVPVTGVAKKLRFKPLQDWVHRFRTRFGARIVYKEGSLAEMGQALRRKEVVSLMVDQSRRSEGLEARYFGRRVTTTPAVAMLALRCRCPVLPVFCVREADGGLHVRVEPPLEIQRSGRLREDLRANTQQVTDAVERMVRRYPEQWLWMHKRWKKFYPGLYPEYQARRLRRHVMRRRVPFS
jgi:KDO2-lipid IV(A) lauroyltransferase